MATLISKIFLVSFIIISFLSFQVLSTNSINQDIGSCGAKSNSCNNKSKALSLKVIAIFTILITSMIGVCLPLFSKSIPSLSPDTSVFYIVKSLASGIILGTGFMHVLPDSFDFLTSQCLPQAPWRNFPFTGFVAMISALLTLMVDSITTSIYTKKLQKGIKPVVEKSPADGDMEMNVMHSNVQFHGHTHGSMSDISSESQLLRYRVIAMVLEMGIVVHSVVIGLSLGASNNVCTIRPLVAALCFHQLFEGMGLGGCILQAEFGLLKKAVMVFFFSSTTPFGVALGIAMSKNYSETNPSSLITVGLLNASSAGLLIYMALVDLLAADFMSQKLQNSVKLQLKCYLAAFIGAGGMSVMAKWA